MREFADPACVVIKHNNPCGAAVGATLVEAFGKAYEGDPLSAFGGILAFNREVDEATALQITEPNRFIECIIAPGYAQAALRVITTRPSWKKSVRLLEDRASRVRRGPGAGLPARRRRPAGAGPRRRRRDDFAQAKVVDEASRQATAS